MNIKESVEYLLSLFSTNNWDEPLNKAIENLRKSLLQSHYSLIIYDYQELKKMLKEEKDKCKNDKDGNKRSATLSKAIEQIEVIITIINHAERYGIDECQPNSETIFDETGQMYPEIIVDSPTIDSTLNTLSSPNNFPSSVLRFDDAIDMFFDVDGQPLPSTVKKPTPYTPVINSSINHSTIGSFPIHTSSVINLKVCDSPVLHFEDELFGLNLTRLNIVKRSIVPFRRTSFSFGLESLCDSKKVEYYEEVKQLLQDALDRNELQKAELERRKQLLLSDENIMLIFQKRLNDKKTKINNLEQMVKSLRGQIEEIEKMQISPQIAKEFSSWKEEKESCVIEFRMLLEKQRNGVLTETESKRFAYLGRRIHNRYGDATKTYVRIRNAVLSRNFDYTHLICSLSRDESLLKRALIESSDYLINSSKHQLLIRREIERKYDRIKRMIEAENSKILRFLRKIDGSINACRASHQKRKVSNY